MVKESKKPLKIFKGKSKVEQVKSGLGDRIRVKVNKLTGIPERIVEMKAVSKALKVKGVTPVAENVAETLKMFLSEHKDTFKVETAQLEVDSVRKVNKRWYVRYQQFYKGIPVHNSIVGLDVSEEGEIGTYAASYFPGIKLSTTPRFSLKKAKEAAINDYKARERAKVAHKDDLLIIYPIRKDDKVEHHLAWKIHIVGEAGHPELDKYFIIDAHNGTLLSSYTARFPGASIKGTVRGEIYPENPTDAVSSQPLRHAFVQIDDDDTATTNNAGHYAESVSWWWQLTHFLHGTARFLLDGPYARVQNSDGSNYSVSKNCDVDHNCDHLWTATDRDHINVFYHMNLFHDWLEDELGFSWVNPWTGTNRFNARVNFGYDNAYSGDPLEFGSNNFARSSDVIYHECTHNILYGIYGNWIGWPAARSEAYAMDEGFADYFAGSFTNESRHGEGYTASPRNLDNTRQYPGKDSYNDEGHTGGTIIGGAGWVLRQRLVNIYGTSGARIADQLILEAHQILSTYPRDYFFSDPHESNLLTALYRAADTDNNLGNGFPYFNDIMHAFHAHSLLQAILEDGDSYDFSANSLGRFTGGDMYYYQGKFWSNNVNQKGVKDLGNIGSPDLSTVAIPTSGYTIHGVNAVVGHTYVAKGQIGEHGSYIIFRVDDISGDKSEVTIRYFYHLNPFWYVANLNTKEIHKSQCEWVSLMAPSHKYTCKSLDKVGELIKDSGYNGCHYCLPRYDTDTKSRATVLNNIEQDLAQ